MESFWFYIKIGLDHVLDLAAYDHILFLGALAVPFTFKNWRKVVLLTTVFTITHCLSLILSVYEIVVLDTSLVEFLIPVTILMTVLFNFIYVRAVSEHKNLLLQLLATAFFGLIHGFGFSNYFKMLVGGEESKFSPLMGFAAGIEISQILIVCIILTLAFLLQSIFKLRQALFIVVASALIALITIPMLIETFPW